MVIVKQLEEIIRAAAVVFMLVWLPGTIRNGSRLSPERVSITPFLLVVPGGYLASRPIMSFLNLSACAIVIMSAKANTGRYLVSVVFLYRKNANSPTDSVFCLFRSLLSASITFEATGSLTKGANERSATKRQGWLARVSAPNIIMHTIFACLLSTIAFQAVYLGLSQKLQAKDNFSSSLFTGAVLRAIEMVTSAGVPVLYMLFPPTVPERQELLKTDHDGINRPRAKGMRKRPWTLPVETVLQALVILCFDWI